MQKKDELIQGFKTAIISTTKSVSNEKDIEVVFGNQKVKSNKKVINRGSKMIGSPKVIRISNRKILKTINYKISVGIKEGLLRTIEWYKYLILV